MNSPENIKMVDSILFTKAVGHIADVSADLSLPEGANIQELLNNNEKETAQKNQENENTEESQEEQSS